MTVKSFVAMLLLILWTLNSAAQSRSEPESLFLTVNLQSAYNPGFGLCLPIQTGTALKFGWETDIVRSSIFAFTTKSERGLYRLKFELKEGVLDKIAYDVQGEPDLDLEVPYKLTFTKYSGFELGYSHTLRLSKESCK